MPAGDVPVRFGIYRPAEPLQPYVTFYYFATTTRPVADFLYPEWGNVRFGLDGEWRVAVAAHYDSVTRREAMLFGPTDRRSLVTGGPGRFAGFGMTPLGWSKLIGGDTECMANAVRPLDRTLGVDPAELLEALGADEDEARSVARLDALLTDLIATRPLSEPRLIAVDAALRRMPEDVADFARMLDLSERSLHRLCLATFGFAPKRLLRRQRFLRTLGLVRAAVRNPVTPSLGEDYYDLPQFYRDFRDFMGMSARDYFAHPRDLIAPASIAQERAGVTLSFALAPPPESP